MTPKTKLSMRRIIKNESFVITRDHLDREHMTIAQVKALKDEGYKTIFYLYDDDDILYYTGYLKETADEFEPLYWAMADSGCTYIKYRNRNTGKFEIL